MKAHLLCVALLFLGVQQAIAQNSWTSISSVGSTPRWGSVSFVVNDKGYLGLGSDNTMFQYDPSTNVWTQRATSSVSMSRASSFVIGGKAYIVCGNNTTTLEYDPVANTYATKAAFIGASRSSAASFVIGNRGYVGVGQSTSTGNALNDFYEYNPATDTWTAKASYPLSVYMAGSFSIPSVSRGYICAGFLTSTTATSAVYEYNSFTNTWTVRTSLPAALAQVTGYNIGSKGYITAGISGSGVGSVAHYEFDPGNNLWVARTNSPFVNQYSTGFGINNKAYVGSGYLNGTMSNAMTSYTPLNGLFTNPFTSNVYCAGSPISVSFNSIGLTFTSNTFTAQLSDSLGNFASPVNIGSIVSTATSGTINATLPSNAVGSGYRIRVTASSPATTGGDNGTSLIIRALPTTTITPSSQTICSGSTTNLDLTSAVSPTTFTWIATGTTTTGFSNCSSGCGTSIQQTLTNAGTVVYTVLAVSNGCSVTSTASVSVQSNYTVSSGSASPSTFCIGQQTTMSVWSLSNSPSNTGGTGSLTPTQMTLVSGNSNVLGNTDYTLNASSVPGTITFNWNYTTSDGAQFDYPKYVLNGVETIFPGFNTTLGTTPQSGSVSIPISSGQSFVIRMYTSDGQLGPGTLTITNLVVPGSYQWFTNPTGGSAFATGTVATVTPATSGTVNYYVSLSDPAVSCTTAPRTAVSMTVNAIPVGSATAQTICSGSASSVALNSTVAGTTFTWTAALISGTATGFSNQTTAMSGQITQTLTNSTTTAAVVRYTVTPTANGCVGSAFTVDVTVNPLPSGSATNQTICSGGTTSIALSSNLAGATYTWTAIQLSGATVTGFSNQTTFVSGPIAQTLTNSNSSVGAVRYLVVPRVNNCNGPNFTVDATVNPIPLASASAQSICSGTATNVTLTSSVSGTTYTWTAALVSGMATGFSNQTTASSGPIVQTLTNTSTTTPAIVRYTVTPTVNNCVGPTFTVDVTVNPIPSGSATGQSICSGSTSNVFLNSTVSGTTYTWTAALISGTASGFSNQTTATNGLIAQLLTNTTATAATVRYTVAPTANTCTGNTFTVDVTVNPVPTGSATAQSVCSGGTTSIVLNSTLLLTTYSWTAAQFSGATVTGFSNQATFVSGPIAQTLTNANTTAGIVRYTVTPRTNNCNGSAFTVDATVNPVPSGSATAQSICSGTPSSVTLNSTVSGTTFTWTAALFSGTATGFSNQTTASSGPIAQTLTNTTTTAAVVRYTVTPSTNNCTGSTFTVDVTVNPIPTGSATAQSVCSGGTTSIALNSTVSGSTYSWTAAQFSGSTVTGFSNQSTFVSGPIAQALTNATTTAGVVRYTVTPRANNCNGSAFTVDATVNPLPSGSATPQTVCSGTPSSVTLNSTVSGTTFTWTAALFSGTATGFSNQTTASGGPIAQTLTNTTTTAAVVRYTVTPSANNCSGSTFTVDVTVNPLPTGSATNQTICSGGTTSIALSSNLAGATYTWTAIQFSGLPVTGFSNQTTFVSGPIAQTLTNSNTSLGTVRYLIVPRVNNCNGPSFIADVTVNPLPTGSGTGQSICSGTTSNVVLSSTMVGTTYTWTAALLSGTATGFSSQPTAASGLIAQTLTNTTTTPAVVRYTVTPTANNCAGNTFTVDITVNPIPSGSATGQAVCSGSTTSIALNSTVSGSVFSWTAAQFSGATVTGFSNQTLSLTTPIAQTLTNNNVIPGVVRYTVTPRASGCNGSTFTVDAIVNPIPTGSATAQAICSGGTTSIALNSSVTGSTFSWTAAQFFGATVTGISDQSTFVTGPIAQTLTNTDITAGVVRYMVTPRANNCNGSTFTVDAIVNPIPSGSATAQAICSGGSTSIVMNSTVTGSTFSWTAAQFSGATVSGFSDQLIFVAGPIAQTLTNASTTTSGVVRYTVTPQANNCNGSSFTVDATVNPIPSGSATTQTICSGSQTSIALNSSITGSTFSWTVGQFSGAAVTGFSDQTTFVAGPIAQTLTNTSSTSGIVRYTVTPQANNCNGSEFTVDATVNPIPVITASSVNICTSDTTNISLSSSTANTEFSWMNNPSAYVTGSSSCSLSCGNVIQQVLFTNNLPGSVIYTVTGTANNCSGTTTVTANVNAINSISSVNAAPSTICAGTPVQLNLWSLSNTPANTGGSGSLTPSTITLVSGNVNVRGNTDYTLTASVSGVITFNWSYSTVDGPRWDIPFYLVDGLRFDLPGFDMNGATVQSGSVSLFISAGQTFTLRIFTADGVSGSGVVVFSNIVLPQNFQWYTTPTGGTPFASGSIISAPTSTAGNLNYYVQVSDSVNSCPASSRTIVSLNVQGVPVGSANAQSICSGATTNITLNSTEPATTFTWTATNLSGSASGFSNQTVAGAGSIAQTLTNAGNTASIVRYTVTPFANGCSGSPFIVDVTVYPIPQVNISGTLYFCSGSSTILTVNYPSVVWSTGDTTTSITVNQPGTYTVTVTDYGCTSSSSVNVIQTAPLSVSLLSFNRSSTCPGVPTILNTAILSGGTSVLDSTVYYLGGANLLDWASCGGNSYATTYNPGFKWYDASGKIAIKIKFEVLASSPYYYYGNFTTPVEFNNTPSGTLFTSNSNYGPCYALNGNLSSTVFTPTGYISNGWNTVRFTNGGPLTLSQFFNVGNFVRVTVTYGANVTWTPGNLTGNSVVVNPGATTTYQMTANYFGCTITDSITVPVYPVPTISSTGSLTICPNGGSATLTSSSGSSYLWSNGETTQSIVVNTSGNFSINVDGCASNDTIRTLYPSAPVIANLALDTICPGRSVTLTAGLPNTIAIDIQQSNLFNLDDYCGTGSFGNGLNGTDYGFTWTDNTNVAPSSLDIILSFGINCYGGILNASLNGNTPVSFNVSSYCNCYNPHSGGSNAAFVNTLSFPPGQYNANGLNTLTISNWGIESGLAQNPSLNNSFARVIKSVPVSSSLISWSTGANTPSITVSNAGTYVATVTDDNGCVQTVSRTIVVRPLPAPTISSIPDLGCTVNLESSPAFAYLWNNGGTTRNILGTPGSTYSVTVSDQMGCTAISNTYTVNTAPGNPAVYGNNVWNVYAWGTGDSYDYGASWTNNSASDLYYAGYYTDTTLNFNSINYWANDVSPSASPTWNGCTVPDENHSFAAKRQGFPCGNYTINIASHDDEAQLWVNDVMVWQHVGCCDSHNAVWSGYLDGSSKVMMRVTEGYGASHGALQFIRSLPLNTASTINNCSGDTIVLTPVIERTALRNYRFASSVIAFSTQMDTLLNSAQQILGAPDQFPRSGLIGGVWRHSTANGRREFIELNFNNPAPINFVDLYQTSGHGAVDTVYVKNPVTGLFEIVYQGTTPTSTSRYMRITFPLTAFNVSQIRLAINSPGRTGYSDYDAVSIGQTDSLNYLWSNGSTASSISVMTSGNYSVTVSTPNGCSATSDTTRIQYYNLPVPVITASDSLICNNSPATLTSSLSSNISWNTGDTSATISVSSPGTYTVTYSNGVCSTSASYVLKGGVSVSQPVATYTLNNNCFNSPVTLTATEYSPAATVGSFNGAGFIEAIQDIPEFNFTIELWIKTGNVNRGIFSATEPAGGHDRHLFIDNTGKLVIRTFAGSAWNTGQFIADNQWHHIALVVQSGVGQKVYVDGAQTPNSSPYDHSDFNWQTRIKIGYSEDMFGAPYIGLMDNLRIWSIPLTQTQVNNRRFEIVSPDSTGLVYQLTFDNGINARVGATGTNGNNAVSLVTSSPYITYLWNGPGLSNASGRTITVSSASVSQTYTVTAVNNGCPSSSSTVIVPAQSIGSVPVVTASGPLTICAGQTVVLTSSSSSDNVWSTGDTTQSITVSTSGVYYVSVNNGLGNCGTSNLVTVTVIPGPVAGSISSNALVCGTDNTNLTLTNYLGDQIQWQMQVLPDTNWINVGSNSPSLSIPLSTFGDFNFRARVSNQNCSDAYTNSITVQHLDYPQVPVISSSAGTSLCVGQTTQLTVTNQNGNLLSWRTGSCSSTFYSSNPVASVTMTNNGTNSYFIRQSNACGFSACGFITLFEAPPFTQPVITSSRDTFCIDTDTIISFAVQGGSPCATSYWLYRKQPDPFDTVAVNEDTLVAIGTPPGIGTYDFQVVFKDGNGNLLGSSNVISIPVVVCTNAPNSLTVRACLQGYFIGNAMTPVLKNCGLSNSTTDCDTVTIEMYDTLHALVASHTGIISTLGYITCPFNSVPSGNYYVVVKHRSSLTTWSASPVQFGQNTVYDFTLTANKAYGDNMVQVAPGIFAIWSGDVTTSSHGQDQFIDMDDLAAVEEATSSFTTGYHSCDLNGDGIVESVDFTIIDNNIGFNLQTLIP